MTATVHYLPVHRLPEPDTWAAELSPARQQPMKASEARWLCVGPAIVIVGAAGGLVGWGVLIYHAARGLF